MNELTMSLKTCKYLLNLMDSNLIENDEDKF